LKKRIKGLADVIESDTSSKSINDIKNISRSDLEFLGLNYLPTLPKTDMTNVILTVSYCKLSQKYLVIDKGWFVPELDVYQCLTLSLETESAIRLFLANLKSVELPHRNKLDILNNLYQSNIVEDTVLRSVLDTEFINSLNRFANLDLALFNKMRQLQFNDKDLEVVNQLGVELQSLLLSRLDTFSRDELVSLIDYLVKYRSSSNFHNTLSIKLAKAIKHAVEVKAKGRTFSVEINFPTLSDLAEFEFHMNNYFRV
jgi:hypothetical protein